MQAALRIRASFCSHTPNHRFMARGSVKEFCCHEPRVKTTMFLRIYSAIKSQHRNFQRAYFIISPYQHRHDRNLRCTRVHKTCGYDVDEIIVAQASGTLGLNDQHYKTLDNKASINLEHLIDDRLRVRPSLPQSGLSVCHKSRYRVIRYPILSIKLSG